VCKAQLRAGSSSTLQGAAFDPKRHRGLMRSRAAKATPDDAIVLRSADRPLDRDVPRPSPGARSVGQRGVHWASPTGRVAPTGGWGILAPWAPVSRGGQHAFDPRSGAGVLLPQRLGGWGQERPLQAGRFVGGSLSNPTREAPKSPRSPSLPRRRESSKASRRPLGRTSRFHD
jgi:hypothetical protein